MRCAVREATIERKTKETNVFVKINLDGTGICNANSGIPFLDHMLDVSMVCSPTLTSTQTCHECFIHHTHGGYRWWFGVQQLSSHGLFDITVEAQGDTHIDDHHTNEDIALALGTVQPLPLF